MEYTTDARLAEVLEQCRQRLARGETVEQCLADYPAERAELTELLTVAARVRALRRAPNAAHAEAAYRRFHAALGAARAARDGQTAVTAVATRGGFVSRWLGRLAGPIVAVLILVGGGFGLVQVSAQALPDSPLYPIKQAQEQVVQAIPQPPAKRATQNLVLARDLLGELQYAESVGKPPELLVEIATDMVNKTSTGVDAAAQLPEPQRTQVASELRPFLANERRAVQRLAASPNRQVAQVAQRLDQKILADDQKLGQ